MLVFPLFFGDSYFFHHFISYTFAGPLLCALLRSPPAKQVKTIGALHFKVLFGTLCGQIGVVVVEKPSYHTFWVFHE